jgi:hypothetical protein
MFATSVRPPSVTPKLRRLAKRAQLRRLLELSGDHVRFCLDYFTVPRYQPLPWRRPDATSARRAEGVLSRWTEIHRLVDELQPRTALDVGCNVGWFALNLAELGISTVGVESLGPYYRTATYGAKRRRADNVAVSAMAINSRTVQLLPTVDCTLMLAVWHHFVQEFGFETATELLGQIWERTNRVLFFETGEEEMDASFGLPPMEPDARTWLTSYLVETCPNAKVVHLGLHHGGGRGPDVAWRNLFAVVREDERLLES